MKAARSVLAVIVGLVLISLIVEPIEFLVVAIVNGGITTDPDTYTSVRNRPPILAAKLVYNTVAAVAGGFVAAWIAGRAALQHGIALAVVQTIAFGWALATPTIRRTTPDWMWGALIVLTGLGIVGGALLQRRRASLVPGPTFRTV